MFYMYLLYRKQPYKEVYNLTNLAADNENKLILMVRQLLARID